MHKLSTLLVLVLVTGVMTDGSKGDQDMNVNAKNDLPLGAFSVSLAVKDIKASREFYEKLGFKSVMGEPTQNWLILRNGRITIGLFQGMFEKNIMTFNPGWNWEAKPVKSFTDVRELQASFEKKGIAITTKADPKTKGPASFVIVDPDGNPILFDQHVPAPAGN